MQLWQLPEHIVDVLPCTAERLEQAKSRVLELYRVYGYDLVSPPLMEYSQSLLADIDEGLALKTIRFVDQLSGRQMALRADITPQVARIDAHLLSFHRGVNRLCYAGSVAHARPNGLLSTREPLQLGAELYGCSLIEADIEVIGLMCDSLRVLKVSNLRLSLGHIGIFRALASHAKLNDDQSRQLLALMQSKDVMMLSHYLSQLAIDESVAKALIVLPKLYGDASVLAVAKRELPKLAAIVKALDELTVLCERFAGLPIHVDLSELSVDAYHSGLLFAAYGETWPDALARGGRYDGLGGYFGCARPATGFSFDLRNIVGSLPESRVSPRVRVKAADALNNAALIQTWRDEGRVVVVDYERPDHVVAANDSVLVQVADTWQLAPFSAQLYD